MIAGTVGQEVAVCWLCETTILRVNDTADGWRHLLGVEDRGGCGDARPADERFGPVVPTPEPAAERAPFTRQGERRRAKAAGKPRP